MAKGFLCPLLQKPYIPRKEQLQIIHPILQQSNPVRAHTKGKPRNLLRVIAVVLHKLEHIRIDHAASQDLNPSRLLARTAGVFSSFATASADKARNIHLRTGLGERKERRPKTGLHTRSKKFFH